MHRTAALATNQVKVLKWFKIQRAQGLGLAGLWEGSIDITMAQMAGTNSPAFTPEGPGEQNLLWKPAPCFLRAKPLEKSEVSKSGPPACMKSPQNQENSDRRTGLLEMVISSSGKLHCRQQPTCSVTSYNHRCCLSQGKSSCSLLAAVSRTLGFFLDPKRRYRMYRLSPDL